MRRRDRDRVELTERDVDGVAAWPDADEADDLGAILGDPPLRRRRTQRVVPAFDLNVTEDAIADEVAEAVVPGLDVDQGDPSCVVSARPSNS